MTSIQGIAGLDVVQALDKSEDSKITGSQSFQYALDAAKNLVDMNKAAETNVSEKTTDFMTGKNDNVVDLMVAQTKSNILMQYSLQVRNNLLSAYKEIMNLSI